MLPIQHQRFHQKCFCPFLILKNHRPHCALFPYKNIMSARSAAFKPQMKQGFYQRKQDAEGFDLPTEVLAGPDPTTTTTTLPFDQCID